MRHVVYYMEAALLALVACLAMVSCTDEPHDGGHGIAVGIDRSACPDAAIGEITITITSDDGTYQTVRDESRRLPR